MSVEIPKMAIAFGAYGIPQGDVIECRVHLGCTKEVGSFELLLQNWNGKYSPNGSIPLAVGMDGHIDIGRGSNVPQIITCRIESIKHESTPTEHYTRVSGRCWGERLFRRTVTKTYENKKGEEIVKDLLDYYVGLSHVRDGTELVENTDTTYTKLEYENTPVFDILKYIAESADKNGVIGFDFRAAPDGKFEFFPKNSKTSPVSLSEKIEVSEYRENIHRIRNKIYVYGTAEKPFPLDKDGQPWSDTLTEDLTVSSGTGYGGSDELIHAVYGKWTVLTGSTNLALDTSVKCAGAKSVKVIEAGYMYYTKVAFQFNAGKEINADQFPQVIFAIYIDDAHQQTGHLQAVDINGKYANKHLSFAKQNEWEKVIIPWGSQNAERWDSVEAGFDWTKIKAVHIAVDQKYVSSGVWRIDMFHFGYGRWKSIQEDTDSQNAYGLRELVEVDEELTSDNACERRAKALLNHLKDPAEYLTVKSTVIDYGTTPLLPGDKIHVTLPNENVDSDFRIETVEYRVDAKTQTLEVSLELGKAPPLLADYLYGLRSTTVTVEKLARTKLGRFKIPTMAGAGVGVHARGHEAGDEAGSQWPNLSTGGWDRITGWISPKHIGPYSDTADIIRFRTKNKDGSAVLDHQFIPSDNEYGIFGRETEHWKELHSKFLILYKGQAAPYGDLRIKVQGEANPKARLTEELLEFGPGANTAPDVYLKRIADNTLELKAQYLLPQTDNILELGSPTGPKRIAKIYASSFLLPTDGFLHIMVYGEDNPKARLTQDSLAFGPGGATAPDTWLKRLAANDLEVSADIIPDSDNARELGVGGATPKRWKNIYAVNITVSNMLFNFHLIPDADNTYDLGEGTTPKRWRDLYLAGAIKALAGGVAVNLLPDQNAARDLGSSTLKWSNLYVNGVGDLGWLNVGGFTVITSSRVLQNVTADAAIITSGQFPLARLPRGTSGYVLEAQGAAYDPMYVNPNGRYTPAPHESGHNNLYPGGGSNTGQVGNTTNYWNCIAGNSVWYKALGQFACALKLSDKLVDDPEHPFVKFKNVNEALMFIKYEMTKEWRHLPIVETKQGLRFKCPVCGKLSEDFCEEHMKEMEDKYTIKTGDLIFALGNLVLALASKVEALEKQLEAKKGVAA